MSSWAKPGVRCVCVDDGPCGPGAYWEPGEEPIVGVAYTIERVWTDLDGEVVMEFIELKRSAHSHMDWSEYVGYGAYRFRPLITQEDDVRLIKSLLVGDEVDA